MTLIAAMQASPAFFLTLIVVLALLIGSFLNVVIHRLPLMLERDWKRECRALLEPDRVDEEPQAPFNLVVPRSRCPQCGHGVTALENVPLISYLFLRGRCAQCKTPISIQYPLVEATSAVLAFVVAWHFGFSWLSGAALVFTGCLLTLAVIDLRTQYLPDVLTLALLWLGLVLNLNGLFTDIQSSVLGAVFGYLSLWSVYHVFKLLTGKEGMGYGDFKLLAALGAWLGWQALPLIVLLSALVGAIVGIGLIVFAGRDKHIPIPYGPFLAAAGWIALLWGNHITGAYLSYTQLR